MAGGLSSLVVLVLSSCMLVGGQTSCSLTVTQFHFRNVKILSAESVGGSTPGVRVTWNTTVPPECVASVRVEFRTSSRSPVVATYTTTNTSQTEVIQTGLQCITYYYISVIVTGKLRLPGGTPATPMLSPTHPDVQVLVGDPPIPVGLRAEATADNTSVRVSWEWSHQGVLMCVDFVRVHYQPEGGSLIMYTVDTTTVTGATLSNLQNNTCYTIIVVSTAGGHRRESIARTVFVPQQDIPAPVGVTAEATADNTSIRVSWEWSPLCIDIVRVHYQPEGGSLMMYALGSTTATSATLSNLHCNTKFTIWVYVESGSNSTSNISSPIMVVLPARAPPTPTEVTSHITSASSVRLAWEWASSGPAPNCFNITRVTYHPERGGRSSLHLSNPAATKTTITDLLCNTSYTVTVVATAGEHRREGVTFLPIQGPQNFSAAVLSSTSIHLTWVAPCHTRQYHIYYRGTCGAHVDEGRLDTDHQEYTFDGLHGDIDYSFTVNQTGFSGGRVFSIGPIYARTFTAVPSGAPQSLEGVFQVFLSWRGVPCIQQNGPITGYAVRYFATCGADKDVQRYKSVVTMDDIISGLTPNNEYAFQVAAVNVNGTGTFSEPMTLGEAPHHPQLVMVTPVNSTSVTVSWSEVQCFNGSEVVTHYLVQYHSSCGGAVQNVTASGTVQTVSGLEPNCVYTFQVAAVGVSLKIGRFSSPVNISLPSDHPEGSNDPCLDEPQSYTPPVSSGVPSQCTSTSAVVGVAVTAVLVLLVVAVVQSAVIWHLRRSIASQTQRPTAVTTEISLKECSAYGQIDQGGGEKGENYIYELPQ